MRVSSKPLLSSKEGLIKLAWSVDSMELADKLVALFEENGISATYSLGAKSKKISVKAQFQADKADYAGFAAYLFQLHEAQVERLERLHEL